MCAKLDGIYNTLRALSGWHYLLANLPRSTLKKATYEELSFYTISMLNLCDQISNAVRGIHDIYINQSDILGSHKDDYNKAATALDKYFTSIEAIIKELQAIMPHVVHERIYNRLK